MCHARRVTSEHATPTDSGAAPDLATLARVVAGQHAEIDRLRDRATTAAVVARAEGAVMALTGVSAEAARETLNQRAKAERRTLLEECWITLGTLPPPPGAHPAPGPAGSGVTVSPPTPRLSDDDVSDGGLSQDASAALAGLAEALVRVGSPRELARCLRERLAPGAGADAVVLYARLPSGGLELVGHAGIDDALAARWQQVSPWSGIPPLEALRAGEPRWLDDTGRTGEGWPPAGDPSGQGRSQAWLPVPPGDVCLGVLRHDDGPFAPGDRDHLRAVARLCAGWLRTFGGRTESAGTGAADAVRRVFDALPVAAVLLAPVRAPSGRVQDFRIDAATPHAARFAGGDGTDPVGRRLPQWLPDAVAEPLRQACLRTLATGEPYESEPFAHRDVADGAAEPATYSVRVAPLGDGLVLSWVRFDASDRQEQRLADLQRLGNLGWANWDLVTHEAAWSDQVFAIFGRDPARGPVGLSGLPGLALADDVPALTRAVVALTREGRPCDVPFRTRTPAGVRHLRIVAEAVTDGEGTPVEVHGFVQDLTARRRAELALVESERAMLTQHDVLLAERTLAARLQDALLPLPRGPVRPAGLRVEVAYLPAQAGVQVGGDWFSAIELPDGDALFVVGDVAGHGVDAVATMAQLRFTAKGMVVTGSSLTGALARLNALLLHSRGAHGTASMVLARYSPGRRRLVWAQAGHLPPLLLRAGKASYLERPRGILLGASTTPVFAEAECLLEPGDRLLLYTDGLVERPPDGIDRGLERLAGAAAAHEADGAGTLEPLLAALLPGDELRDDVCVLDIQVPDGPARRA
ncbi:SpoIIE family protein phosphatase [Streptomyces flaveolus]|uniref:SpoIIE family protein phosphatase n=1 Tax=Streptomyces flaveolus TaxID=67297 RepID=UPI001671138A|nr:SpoIIE family protein phosphatase [Streptomyces flaveolus]GGQ83063.1 transcription antitermination regulator [Streptomyces flaveolus]